MAADCSKLKPDQRWREDGSKVRVTKAFGVRILIGRSDTAAGEEIIGGDFSKRFTSVADK
jgi:hypothetical protein